MRRARGWICVVHTDVLLTLFLLSLATIPFYMLGAGVLNWMGRIPDGLETVGILSNVYTETLGVWAWWLFMFGAFLVLFSTVISGLGGERARHDVHVLLLRRKPGLDADDQRHGRSDDDAVGGCGHDLPEIHQNRSTNRTNVEGGRHRLALLPGHARAGELHGLSCFRLVDEFSGGKVHRNRLRGNGMWLCLLWAAMQMSQTTVLRARFIQPV